MQQIPMGKDGRLTDEQKRRAVFYAFDQLAGAISDSDEDRELAKKLKEGFMSTPKDSQ